MSRLAQSWGEKICRQFLLDEIWIRIDIIKQNVGIEDEMDIPISHQLMCYIRLTIMYAGENIAKIGVANKVASCAIMSLVSCSVHE